MPYQCKKQSELVNIASSSQNYQLNLAFYNHVFEQPGGEFQRLGDIFMATKNNSLNGVLNRNFSLLGDPSMKLSYAHQLITIDSLNDKVLNNSDTLSALEELTFKGFIRRPNNSIDNTFNGDLEVTILDKTNTKKTIYNAIDKEYQKQHKHPWSNLHFL